MSYHMTLRLSTQSTSLELNKMMNTGIIIAMGSRDLTPREIVEKLWLKHCIAIRVATIKELGSFKVVVHRSIPPNA